MKAAGFDALLLTNEPEFRYFSGFLSQFWHSPTRPWFLILPLSGKPIAVVPSIGASALSKTWLEDIRTWSSPCPEDEGITLLTDTLRESVGGKATIGLPMGAESIVRMPQLDFQRLQTNLSNFNFRDANAIMRSLRVVKSEGEIEKIRFVCQAASTAFEQLPAFIVPGISQYALTQRFKQLCLDAGVDDIPYMVGGADQGGYDDIISPPSDQSLRKGDVLILDTGCVWDGYFCDFDRNYSIGKPNAKTRQVHHQLWDATEAAIDIAMPGDTCADLFHTMQNALGIETTDGGVGRFGHGLGMQLTEHPSNAAFDKTELKENMVITLEPSLIYGANKMMVHEENIVIRADGVELLSRRAQRDIVEIQGFG